MSASSQPLILVVDDDEEIRELLARYLASQGFVVAVAWDRKSLHQALDRGDVSLVVLDVMLPDGSGIEICRDLRAQGTTVPIILLTALKEEVDRIIGLEVGADDYLGKPFNPRELAARIRAVLRRQAGAQRQSPGHRVFHFEGFTLEPATRRIQGPSGVDIDLTAAEFELLHALVSRPGRVLARDQLLNFTHARDTDSFDRSVDVLMSRIRRKLSDECPTKLIKTIRNGGYQFAARVDLSGADP